jgi:hypothetical protein
VVGPDRRRARLSGPRLSVPGAGCSRLSRQLSLPDDAIGTEVTPAGQSDGTKTHVQSRWPRVDQRPYLRTARVPDAPHHRACPCWQCGDAASLSGPAQHEDGCVCWECEPDRWRGERHRRLLRVLRRQREIYDAQNSRTGVYDLLPFLSRVGMTWLCRPAPVSDGRRWAPTHALTATGRLAAVGREVGRSP